MELYQSQCWFLKSQASGSFKFQILCLDLMGSLRIFWPLNWISRQTNIYKPPSTLILAFHKIISKILRAHCEGGKSRVQGFQGCGKFPSNFFPSCLGSSHVENAGRIFFSHPNTAPYYIYTRVAGRQWCVHLVRVCLTGAPLVREVLVGK